MSVGTFKVFPKELEESAYVDGSGKLSTFLRIVLPPSKMMLITMAMFAFLIAWSEYPFALVLLRKQPVQTVSVALGSYIREFDVYWNEMAAAAVIVSLPIIAIFQVLQKYMVRGLLSGALKGI
jgi:ABC-type glycerol-3-phosphate transport system permease component